MPSTFRIVLTAIRPKTLGAAIAPVLLGTAMAYQAQKAAPLYALLALLTALLIQIGTNLANDYFDFQKGADNEERLGPTRVTQAGWVTPKTIRTSFLLVFFCAFLLGSILALRGGWVFLLIGALSIGSGILYTGGPYPLGYNGLGDIFVLIFFGPVAVGGTYYVQTLSLPASVLVAGLAPGLLATALLAVNNLRDIDTDQKAGKRTLAVRFGKTFAQLEYIFVLTLALGIPVAIYFFDQQHPYLLLSLFTALPALPLIKKLYTAQGHALNEVLAKTGLLLLVHSSFFSIGWLL